MYRVLFFGTDTFSATSLRALHASPIISSIKVISKNPKPQGRGQKPYITNLAGELGLEAFTLETLPPTRNLASNIAIAVSFGHFISPQIVHGLCFGGINLHPSLLPRYRGPAPIHRAIMNGDTKTGVSVQTLDTKHFDHGRILAQRDVVIEQDEGITSLHDRLAQSGAELLLECLQKGLSSSVYPPYKPSYALKVTKTDMEIDFSKHTAREILNKARAFSHLWTWSIDPAQRTQIKEISLTNHTLPVGYIERTHDGLLAGTVEGTVYIRKIKRAGGEWQLSKL